MAELLSGWVGQLGATAGIILALAGIFGIGFRFGERERRRKLEIEIEERDQALELARTNEEASRAEALRWKSRFEETQIDEPLKGVQKKLEVVREIIDDARSLWLAPPNNPTYPRAVGDGGRPILTIGNLKGGVGKTTLSVHLAAALAKTRRVLFIDLDYQGSGSTFLLRAAERDDVVREDRSRSSVLLQRFAHVSELKKLPVPLGSFAPNLSVIPAYYPLADLEENMMLRWAIGDEPEDIRYHLSSALQSGAFDHDLIIIDAPPRLTTGMAQAIAASTHVLVPTQLERKSSEAALYFAATLKEFTSRNINPRIKFAGIVPNMVEEQTGYKPAELVELKYLKEEVSPLFAGEGLIWDQTPIYDKTAFKRTNLVSNFGDRGSLEAAASITRMAEEVARRVF